jgi:hypothetical protein
VADDGVREDILPRTELWWQAGGVRRPAAQIARLDVAFRGAEEETKTMHEDLWHTIRRPGVSRSPTAYERSDPWGSGYSQTDYLKIEL